MPSEKWQMGDKDVDENITLSWVKGWDVVVVSQGILLNVGLVLTVLKTRLI